MGGLPRVQGQPTPGRAPWPARGRIASRLIRPILRRCQCLAEHAIMTLAINSCQLYLSLGFVTYGDKKFIVANTFKFKPA